MNGDAPKGQRGRGQKEAANINRAPKIHSVTDYSYQHETPEDILGSLDTRYGTDDPRHKVIEMDRVKTVLDQGGKVICYVNILEKNKDI